MAGPLLIPVTLSAKVVVGNPLPVPDLTGKPFNRDGALEPGVHLHWSLPDALSGGRAVTDDSPNVAVFPGIPDLWLVLRVGEPGGDGRRPWRAWVVDSIDETVTTVEAWVPPARDAKLIHTRHGALSSADGLGWPGWGVLTTDDGFQPLAAAYYPASRNRIGLHDPLGDLGKDFAGKVTYTVIGWYSLKQHDPLHMSDNRQELLERWRLSYEESGKSYEESPSPIGGTAIEPLSWSPAVTVTEADAGPALSAMVANLGPVSVEAARSGQLLDTAAAFTPVLPGIDTPVVSQWFADVKEPCQIVCHGSVAGVPLGWSGSPLPPVDPDHVKLYPSVKRAMAETVAATGKAELVEMLLQDLDQQKGTDGGVVDLPAAAHQATFQSASGKARRYARIDVYPPVPKLELVGGFSLLPGAFGLDDSTGHSPPKRPPAPGPGDPHGPSGEVRTSDSVARQELLDAYEAVKVAAANRGTPVEDRLVHVHDHRAGNEIAGGGPLAPVGSDRASGWLDVQDVVAVDRFLHVTTGATLVLPDVENLLVIPGDRWYRPWSPHVVLEGTDRSYLQGDDGRFNPDGRLTVRASGEALSGLIVGSNQPVYGMALLNDPAALFSVVGLPAEARSLVNEALLLDPDSAPAVAAAHRGVSEDDYRAAVYGIWLSRDATLAAQNPDALANVLPLGVLPSAVATTPWKRPRHPLFVDVAYAHTRSTVAADWELLEDHVDFTPQVPGQPVPPGAPVSVFNERTPVDAMIAEVLKSTLVTRETVDPDGQLVVASSPPSGIDEGTFANLDLVSGALTKLDSAVFAEGLRERSGALRLDDLDLVDTFGEVRPMSSGDRPTTDLPPRLPYWARLRVELRSADHPDQDASTGGSPICGVLIPDLIEHALEVFDGAGRAIGQLSTDRPQFGNPGPDSVTLEVRFDLHPWVATEMGLPAGGDPLDAIADPTLRSLVASIRDQPISVGGGTPAQMEPENWRETGLTALLRVIDTVRATIAPDQQTRQSTSRLLGEPILLVAARISLEGTPATSPAALGGGPTPLTEPPARPTVPVRLGDVTRPDDGVLGFYLRPPDGGKDADGQFAPVSTSAANGALLNGIAEGCPLTEVPVTHDFVADTPTVISLTVGAEKDVVLLVDARGALHTSCGVLPRKRTVIQPEFVDTALGDLVPTFPVGPLLTATRGGQTTPMLPPPGIAGVVGEFVHAHRASPESPATYSASEVPPTLPVGALPIERVVLDQGWLRLVKIEG